MSKYKQTQQASTETVDIAMSIAKGIKKPNQSKEQTKLIAQGIQKGIAEYKKQQKSKARELDKLKNKVSSKQNSSLINVPITEQKSVKQKKCKSLWIPWSLLVISWSLMLVFIYISTK
jgi:hypothetical protein